MMRRTALEGHLSSKRLMVVMGLGFSMWTGEVPRDEEMVGMNAAKAAFTKLGAHDDWREGVRNQADRYGWGMNTDGASKKRPHGRKHMHLGSMSRWSEERLTPQVMPLCARELEDEGAVNSAKEII
jgi:hypothetical protein